MVLGEARDWFMVFAEWRSLERHLLRQADAILDLRREWH